MRSRDDSETKSRYGLKSGKEMRLYGFHSCFAVFEKRRQDIVRVYVTEKKVKTASAVLKFCADHKKAYHIVTDEELSQIVSSVHHEGIAMVIKRQPPIDEVNLLKRILHDGTKVIYFLDGVGNPHNLGAIMRTLAHFGVEWILGNEESLPELSPSAARTSEGASELVNLVKLNDPLETLRDLKLRGWDIVGTSSHNANNLYDWKPTRRTVIILGSETTGISKEIEKICTVNLVIPGTGKVESLNVSVAAGIMASYVIRGLNS